MHVEFEERHGNRMVYSPKFRQAYGTKEAQTIGMTRGFPLLTKKLGNRARRVSLCALFLLMALGASSRSARAQSASGWDKRGQAAELREDYDTAYEDYLKAHLKSPKDMRYQARLDRMRFQAAAQHVDRGRVLRESGDIAGALNQFTRAKQIDPSNEAASQEIALTERQDRSSAAAPLSTMPSASTAAMQQEVGSVAAPAMLKGISSEPITLHIVEDVKNIYTTIGQMAGLNVLFDPDYTSKRIQVDLKNVSLSDALHVIGVQSQTFYKPVTADTIYVAANTFTKHADLDEEAVQTFYLTNSVGQADANDIATVLRNILGSAPGTAIVPMISQNAIVVRESPDKLLLVEKLINDLDRPRAEVVVDVAILEVNRDKVRNLGITLPQSVGLTPQQTPNADEYVGRPATTGTAQASNFTLNTLGHFNSTNLAVTIGGGTLNALMTDADTRVLQNPSVRATDGQKATLKIGSKIPVATGSFGAATGIGGGALGGLGVNTQFNYLDVGVTIDMTPSIHLDRQVSMVLDVENSTETGQATLAGGVTQPIIGTRSDKTTIQLRDGEPCLLAAILTKQDNTSNSGTPGLSSIPLLKYLFGSVYKEKQQDEVVFVLVPHIVRESTLTGLNTRAIDTGTAQDIEIRRSDPYCCGPGGSQRRPGAERKCYGGECGVGDGAADEAAGDAAGCWKQWSGGECDRHCACAGDACTCGRDSGFGERASGQFGSCSGKYLPDFDCVIERARRVLGADAASVRSKGSAVGERRCGRAACRRWTACGAGASRRRQRPGDDLCLASSGCERRGWPGRGVHVDLQGSGRRRYERLAGEGGREEQPAGESAYV